MDARIVIGPETCADVDASSRLEWLVTNGIGGYAFGTVSGMATRSYHGLLVAALAPPVGRTVLVGGLEAWATVGGRRWALHRQEFLGGRIEPGAPGPLVELRLEGTRPVWTYDLDGVFVERQVWMAYGSNTSYVRYEIVSGSGTVQLDLVPLVTHRDHHELHLERDGVPTTSPLRILAPSAAIKPLGEWRRGFVHREETARGLLDTSDLWAPSLIRATIEVGRSFTLVFTADASEPPGSGAALASAIARDRSLLAQAAALDASPFVQDLVLAADQFIVARDIPTADGVEHGRSVIAGYPWFNDWGRDTMIALPGLCLATGRHDEAATILRSFARFVRDGLLPNDFPDRADVIPAYHTIDASLWYPMAVRAHAEATGRRDLVDELLPTLRTILDAHIAGTRFGIGMDPADGLLRGGEDGVQLTWMDARVDGWVVTPRRGKPVEIQALWINALRTVGGWLSEGDDAGEAAVGVPGRRYLAIADTAEVAFRDRFWRPDLGYLLDVVDGPDGDDASLRPNQIFAVSLPHPLVTGTEARSIVDAVGRSLAVPLGLRSLAPTDPSYRPWYQGDRLFRDAGYHQGTVWTWLIGAYAQAVALVQDDPKAGLAILRPFVAHLRDAGLGSVSEILEPEPPFLPRGCPFQAWGVAEVLRAWRALGGE